LVREFPEAIAAGRALRRAGLTVAVAESCTGGLLGAALTAVAGASDYVRGGVIAYADDVKDSVLGVSAELIRRHGAVSEPVAEAMARSVRRRLGTDLGLGITGIAGPRAEGSSKPAGLIFVAVAGPGDQARVVRLEGDHGREPNRAAAVRQALRLCVEACGGTSR